MCSSFEIDGLCDLYQIAGDNLQSRRERANCELHFQKETTALSPKTVLDSLSEATQEFCFLQMGRNVFLVQRKPKEQRAQELAAQDRHGMDHGSWINAAPK